MRPTGRQTGSQPDFKSGFKPGFLPPLPTEPDPVLPGEPTSHPEPGTAVDRSADLGVALHLAAAAAAMGLLVSAFMSWVHVELMIGLFGQTVDRDLGDVSGVDVDGTGRVLPVLAMISMAIIAWGLLAHSPRLGALAAVPGGLALLCGGVFPLRLDQATTDLIPAGTEYGYRISVAHGWFVSMATAFLVVGLSLAGAAVARIARRAETGQS